ncbi:hypothetical protein GCM10010174_52960 [Kutzneria viridogrisea]
MSSAVPKAATQTPTTTALELALTVLVKVVAESTVTAVSTAGPPAGLVPCVVNPLADTALTVPNARPAAEGEALPLGLGWRLGSGVRLGFGVRLAPPLPGTRQPLVPAWVIVTDLAVSGWPATAGPVPVTSTQEPAVTSRNAPDTVSVNVVLSLKVTATWPFCGFCTWAVDPVTAATVPKAPGRVPPCPGPREELGAWVPPEGVADEPPPQAARVTESAPATSTRPDRRAAG